MKTHVVQTFPIPAPKLEMGQKITAIAAALDQFGAPIDKGPVTWSSSFPEVPVVQPTMGEILSISSGMTQIIATVAGKEGHRTLTVSPPPILINEVEEASFPFNLTVAASKGATNICG